MYAAAAWVVQVIIAIVLAVLAYVFAPKPKQATPDESARLESPRATAGAPIPVVFGEVLIKAPNALWYGSVSTEVWKVNM